MVRLRKLLDQGSEVTFLPGDGSDENRVYDVHVVTVEGNGFTASGPTPQSAESFLPKVHESRQDFETGPVCDGLLAAAQWTEHHIEASR